VFCAPDANSPPRASRSCWLEPGRIAECDSDGGFALENCPAGQQCAVAGGVRCVPAVCPASGEATACVDDRWLGQCRGGTVVDATDCQRFGGRCVRGPSGAACETPDAGAPDAGAAVDTAVDVPAVDAPSRDAAGVPRDVTTDLGVTVDAEDATAEDVAQPADAPRAAVIESGCGCRATDGRAGGAPALALVAALLRRRRRRRAP